MLADRAKSILVLNWPMSLALVGLRYGIFICKRPTKMSALFPCRSVGSESVYYAII